MADYKKAFEIINSFEGGLTENRDGENMSEILLCSNCFKDEGLRLDAEEIGIQIEDVCPNCGLTNGKKLSREALILLSQQFFVRGTLWRADYGGTPRIQFNNQNYKQSHIDVSEWLKRDVEIIQEALKIGFFYYGPRLWMIGHVKPLENLLKDTERSKIIDRILIEYPVKILSPKDPFYRIRVNLKNPTSNNEYDSPPELSTINGRLDSKEVPILYASQDLEVCIHECRVTIEDDVFVAKLVPTKELRLLDLTEILDENKTEFESLDIAVHMLFLAGKHSYPIARMIAIAAFNKGFDGVIYPSFFSLIRTGAMPFDTIFGMSIRRLKELRHHARNQIVQNIALFGRPVNEKKVSVECINKVILNRVIYNISFGPACHKITNEEDDINVTTNN